MQTSETGDSLLIQPGIPGDGTGVDVKSIRIDVLGFLTSVPDIRRSA